jgi:hypothetical protein
MNVPPSLRFRCSHSQTDRLEWLAYRLTMLCCEFEVHGPPELAGYLRELGASVTRASR